MRGFALLAATLPLARTDTLFQELRYGKEVVISKCETVIHKPVPCKESVTPFAECEDGYVAVESDGTWDMCCPMYASACYEVNYHQPAAQKVSYCAPGYGISMVAPDLSWKICCPPLTSLLHR